MMEVFVGTILPVGFNFAPVDWLPCDGRLLPISQYETLYTLLGTTYGGNGQTTFGLPDLRGRVPIGYGQGPGLPNYVIGQAAGAMSATMTSGNLPTHNHIFRCGAIGTTATASNDFPANTTDSTGAELFGYISDLSQVTQTLAPGTVTTAGGSIPIDTIAPYQVINYVIAPFGIYPQQS